MTLVTGSAEAAMVFKGPATGGLEGAWRGMRIGFVGTLRAGAAVARSGGQGAGAAVLAAIALAPVAAVVGGVAGAVVAEPGAKIVEKEAQIRTALSEVKIQEAFRGCIASALRDQGPHIAVVAVGESASTILEVTVEEFGLAGDTWDVNPPLRFIMTERTRVTRAADAAELYTHWLTWRGQLRPLDDWVTRDAAAVQEEGKRACRDLAESLVDEVFLVYLVTDER